MVEHTAENRGVAGSSPALATSVSAPQTSQPVESQPVAAQPVAIIGAGLDLGAGRRGVDMGPSAIRYAGLEARVRELGREVADWGDVRSPVPEATDEGDETCRYLTPIKQVCDRVGALVEDAVGQGYLPLVLGGDHSIAMGTLGGMAKARGAGAALWIDAHGDLNRPSTSPRGNVHGMPLAAALGAAGAAFASDAYPTPSVTRAALIGIRSLDPGERALIRELDVRVFTMNEVDRHGMERVLNEALGFLSGAAFLHLSLDLDAVDPMFAPGVGTPVRGGLSYREAHLAMELLSESNRVDSMEVVEVNPVLDRENATGELAVELVASALGARIL
ncbi:MAG: arginase [Gaiellaceae bacterium]|nr:arginase [Gaiellaceae bacterium]